jgi:flagella basal body P-ring formation protein FlgA
MSQNNPQPRISRIARIKTRRSAPLRVIRGSIVLLVFVPALIALGVFQGSVSAVEVRLRSTASSTSRIIRLSDVAEVLGEAEIATALADVALCPAPAAGHERTLTQAEVRGLLLLSGLERNDCVVTGSESVTVAGSTSAAAGARPRQPLIASGVRQAIFEADPSASASRPVKPVSKEGPAPPAANAPPLVERGATVTVNARTAGVRITTSGKALEAGKAGDSINVELADSKQRILATVVGVQAVEVTDGSSPLTAIGKPQR